MHTIINNNNNIVLAIYPPILSSCTAIAHANLPTYLVYYIIIITTGLFPLYSSNAK